MRAVTWYDLFPDRLVLEVIRVKSFRSDVTLKRINTTLYWECETSEIPEGLQVPPLRFLLAYPQAFPAIPPNVEIVSPELDPTELGHEWHRWFSGDVCYVRPVRWQVSTTADEIIAKVGDWYFNYTAKKAGMISKMPDVGRAVIPPNSAMQ